MLAGCSAKFQIESGLFSSVAVYQDLVFAVANQPGTPSTVHVYRFCGGGSSCNHSWQKVHCFSTISGWVTMSVRNEQIRLCAQHRHDVTVYSNRGDELLRTYDTNTGSGDDGESRCLDNAFICDDDNDGSVLIADRNNNRLQVMSEHGEFSVLQLQPQVSWPRSAVLFKNDLFVTSMDKKTIHKYMCGP